MLQLQRDAGNRAVAQLVIQRTPVAHTPAKKVPGILAADPLVAGYVGKEGGGALTVKVHPRAEFQAAYLAYAKRKGVIDAKARVGVTAAFTDVDKGVIHLDRDRGDPGTIVHEALHLRSSKAWIEEEHPKINEGTTELFTRRVCKESKIERSEDSYPEYLGAMEQLVSHSSVEALAAAYFRNDTKGLEADIEAVRPGLWTDWKITIAKSVIAANALLAKAAGGT